MEHPQNNTEVPRDVRLLHLIFATQGVQSYQDHVPLQLMDFAYRYTTGVLQDAVIYNDHAYAALSNAGNVGSHNSQLSNEDIRLAIAARTNYQFKPVPPKKLLMKLAAERNEKPLPPVMPAWGIRLPPEKYCLTAKDWDLSEQESEDVSESLDERTSILESITDLGPPDMVHLKKQNNSVNTKTPIIGSYFYYTGADVSNSATIAALLNSLSNIIGEEPQLWFGKHKPWKVVEATYCTYNAFSKIDVRVSVNFPGKVESMMMDSQGNLILEDDQLWLEAYVSGIVRALISADSETADFSSIVEIRKINPFLNKSNTLLFFKGFEELYFSGTKLGCSEELQLATSSNNYLVDSFIKCTQLTGYYKEAIEIVERIAIKDPSATYLIAKLHLLNNEEVKFIRVLHDGIKLNPLDGELLSLQAEYCMHKKRLDLALPIAIKAINSAPSYFKPWSILVKIYIALGNYKQALLTLNSCPMVTHKDKYNLKRINNPKSEDLHLPLPMDVTLDQVSTLNSMDIAIEHSKVDQLLLNLPASNLKSTFAKTYLLLTEIVYKTGWESLLKFRTQVFVMEEEFKKDARVSIDNGSTKPPAATATSVETNGNQDFKKKRLCERWLDNLFMLLYEDLRIYTMFRAEMMHFEAQQLELKKTTLEWEVLGLVSERLGHKKEAEQCYKNGLKTRFSVRASKHLLNYYSEMKSTVADQQKINILNDEILQKIVNLLVWNHRWYCSFSPMLTLALYDLINDVGRVKIESEIKVTIGNAHDDLIHDAVLDYYGKRLATCSSDKTIKIFEVEGENHKLVETLRGHDGPVWQVSWAHPKFGVILASCSYDGKVLIWKENGAWSNIAEHSVHQASVNSISWAPSEYGAMLLCTSSDGKASVVEFLEDGSQKTIVFQAHSIGVNAGSWAPPQKDNIHEKRLVTGGCDNTVKIWKFDGTNYVEEASLTGHTDWVRDVAWSPSLLSKSYIATASQDRTVIIWTKESDEASGAASWKKQLLTAEKFPDVCWRASWSLSGNVLAISGGDNKVTLWKENLNGKWESAGEVDQ
ncbi:hypothetical protein CANARDRAFT_209731 [[Candida] arabinofermentans NRRL YB-2248]|uniref:Uncharacterized protein n=1 Tax=[Candida] arabinofermentans NRRL YB-2248 TaxID=983967 RepID=A0A1E4STA6_9ASCO|nr:hypothetical protein CANARDRAFT_209731 [[Candida] arabinofermentans NRRL YB-2248]